MRAALWTSGARAERLRLAFLIGLALALRSLAWHRAGAMMSDGPVFLGLARLIQAGEWAAALAHPYHPLYPGSVAAVHSALMYLGGVASLESAAVFVSVIAGTSAVALLYVWLRDAYDARTAWIGALILAVHPYAVRFSGDVQSEGLYLALFLASVALLWRALRSRRWPEAAAAGIVCGLAYLTRPEGLAILLIGLGYAAAMGLGQRGSPRRALAWGTALLLGAALAVGPYVTLLHAQTGSWTLTQKKAISELFGQTGARVGARPVLAPEREVALLSSSPFLETVLYGSRRAPGFGKRGHPAVPAGAGARGVHAGMELSEALFAALGPVCAVLVGFSLLTRRGRPGAAGRFVLIASALQLVLLIGLAYGTGYVSKRHALPVVTLWLGTAALAVPRLGRLVTGPRLAPRWATALVVGLVVVASAPRAAAPRRTHERAVRAAAEWLRDQPVAGAVAGERQRVAYYAGAPFVSLPAGDTDAWLAYLRGAGASHLVVDAHRLAMDPGLRLATQDMSVLHRVKRGRRTGLVYALEPETLDVAGGTD